MIVRFAKDSMDSVFEVKEIRDDEFDFFFDLFVSAQKLYRAKKLYDK